MAVSWSQVAAHRERLLKIARRRCPTREDAEDVVQEAMIRTATFADLDEARLGQFLTAVTLRLCADVYRSAERGARAVRHLATEDVPSPEVAALAAAEAEELRALLATLPDRQRDVLVDRADGLSVTQISTRHSLTYKATESALSRARAAMRLALASAMGAVAAAFAAVRRRPAVALALPLVAVAFVTVPHRTPSPNAAPGVGGEAAPSVEELERPATAAYVAPVRPATRAHAVAVSRPLPKPRRATGGSQGDEERTIVRVNPVPFIDTSTTTTDEPPEQMVARCLEAKRYTVDAFVEPNAPEDQEQFGAKAECHDQ